MKIHTPSHKDVLTYLRVVLPVLMSILYVGIAFAGAGASREFEYISTGGLSVNSLFNDGHGRTLAASSDGLLIYDGKIFKDFTANENGVTCNENIAAALPMTDENLMLCTANGLYNLDLRTDIFSFIFETASLDVRTVARLDSAYMLLGTMNGLVTVKDDNRQTRKLNGVPSQPYYSLLVNDGKVYAGSDGGLIVFDSVTKKCTTLPIADSKGGKALVTALAYDKIRGCIWIGSNSGVMRYSESSGEIQRIDTFSSLSINAIMVDGVGDVWIGSNHGLFIFNDTNGVSGHYTHNAFDRMSLIDNDVKALFEDEFGNVWIGTATGVSFYCRNSNFTIQRWGNLSHSSEGNRITTILVDSNHTLWIGGANGLLRHNQKGNQSSNNSEVRFSGHRINNIYEDSDKNIWVATDMGPHRYDSANDRFTAYTIRDAKGHYSATDCISMFEDSTGNLWVSAKGSGVFVIDKNRLAGQSSSTTVTADRHFYTLPGSDELISQKIDQAVMDRNGNLWVGAGVDGLTKIYPDSGRIEYFSFTQSEKHLNVKDILALHCDNEGKIWIVGKERLDKIDPDNDAITHIEGDLLDGKVFNGIVDQDDNLWLLYPDGIVVMNKDTHRMMNVTLPESNHSGIFLDRSSGMIWVGGMDHVLQFSPEAVLMPSSVAGSLSLSSLSVNNQEIYPDQEYDGNVILRQSLPFTKEITLKPSQNNLDLGFICVRADKGNVPRFRYRITDSDDDWREIEGQSFRLSLSNLPRGTFTLQVEQLENDGTPADYPPYELKVTVLPHWYLSIWAKIVYALIAIGLIAWGVKYNYMKSRLRFERLEKEKVKELSNMKINFLTDIAHELKTPLTLILEPINKLLSSAKGSEQKATLQIVRNNALHLGKLVHQVLDLRNADLDDLKERVYPLELVEFITSVVATFKEAAESRNIGLAFSSSRDSLFIMTDALKMESILRNLISNALKFTPDGGKVEVGLSMDETDNGRSAILTVSDNGVGIPADDVPKIFDRFYQSEHSRSVNKDGSGIGLSVVKTYVAQFNGEIKVESQLNEGTTFTVTLPVTEATDYSSATCVSDSQNADIAGVKVLIVEDNADIARFISENLKNMECRIAHNGKSGFETAKTFNPDVIISDIMMPIMDGVEMSRLLKNNPSTSAIPIILLTAKGDRITEYEAYGIGVDAFIPKPFEIGQLVIRIKQLLKSKLTALDTAAASNADERTASALDSLASADERFTADITRIIEEHIDDSELNVQRLAELSGINAKQIYRKIKLTTGTTVVDYIKSIRMKKAAQLLSQKQFTVSEVMYMVGFSSSSYFSKCFTEKYGKTPKNYLDL